MKGWIMKVAGALIFCAMVSGSCSYLNKKLGQEDDWWGEELLEEVIDQNLQIRVDLTPSIPHLIECKFPKLFIINALFVVLLGELFLMIYHWS